jgi:hypothetical protein
MLLGEQEGSGVSEVFDPYHRWLGIPPKDQPPNYYRLLSLELFESDPAVIEAAADRQMGHLRTYQTGPHADLSQMLLNEVAAAKICLLHPEKRARYDAKLRQVLELRASERRPPVARMALDPEVAGAIEDVVGPPTARPLGPKARRRQATPAFLLSVLTAGIACCVAAVAVLVWRQVTAEGPPKDGLVQAGPGPVEPKKVDPSSGGPTSKGGGTQPAPGKEPDKKPTPTPSTKPQGQKTRQPEKGSGEKKTPAAKSGPSGSPPRVKLTRPEDQSDPMIPGANLPQRPEQVAEPGDLPDAQALLPVPSEADQQKSRKLVEEVYGKELGKAKTPAERLALAKRLIQDAEQAKNDPSGRFVLLMTARDVASGAGDVETAFRALEALEAQFDVDAPAARADLAEDLLKQARGQAEQRAAAEKAVAVAEEAIEDDNFEVANRLLKLAQAAAVKARSDELRERVRLRLKQCQEAEKRFAEAEQARQTLKTRPDDPEANLTLGKYLCFVKEDWEGGVPHLARTSDPALKALAEKELAQKEAGPSPSIDERIALADGWWDLAEKGETGRPLRQRAGTWYRAALNDLPQGLLRTKVQNRLEELAALEASSTRPGSTAKRTHLKLYEGTWILAYQKGNGRRYVIDAEGNVSWGPRRARLTGRGADLILDFGDGKLERVRLAGRRLQVEHFDPATSFPRKPTQSAVGDRIRLEKKSFEDVCRALRGKWTIKYLNGVSDEYTIDDRGSVTGKDRRSGSLSMPNGEVLLDFRDGRLQRLELRSSLALYLEHFFPGADYPHTILTFGVGARKP